MKKYVILLITLFLLTGCTSIYDKSYDEIVSDTLETVASKPNTYLEGYKLYLPNQMTIISSYKNNNILYSYGDKYFLYVDLISYYNEKENTYKIDHNSYKYSKEIDIDGKKGYVIISESKGGDLVEAMYGYAKIEVITTNPKRALTDALVVLKSIKYNYKIIDSMIGSNTLVYDTELFKLMGPDSNKDNFLSYEKEYGEYNEDENAKDEDIIDMKSLD